MVGSEVEVAPVTRRLVALGHIKPTHTTMYIQYATSDIEWPGRLSTEPTEPDPSDERKVKIETEIAND